MNIKKLGILAATATAMLAGSSTASAASLLDQVSCAEVGPGGFTCDTAFAVVGAGPEFNVSSFFSIDFSPGFLTISALSDGSLGGTILEFTNLTNPWTSASLISGSVPEFDASDVTLSAGTLTIDFSDQDNGASVGPFALGDQFLIALSPGGAVVPEPATWAMLVLGFGLVGATMRRRKAYGKRATLA